MLLVLTYTACHGCRYALIQCHMVQKPVDIYIVNRNVNRIHVHIFVRLEIIIIRYNIR